jgi:hypothetical protein
MSNAERKKCGIRNVDCGMRVNDIPTPTFKIRPQSAFKLPTSKHFRIRHSAFRIILPFRIFSKNAIYPHLDNAEKCFAEYACGHF